MKVKVIIIVCLFMTIPLSASAEVLVLKNGRRAEGKVVESTKEYIKIDVEGATVTFYRDEIESIEKIVPAIIVKDEQQKKEVLEKVINEKKADRIYLMDEKVRQSKKIGIRRASSIVSEAEEVGVKGSNIGIHFTSIKDNPDFLPKDPGEETEEERKRREAMEYFYNNR